jgi:tetratricopeptide (TPR) repeat protein
MRHAFATVVVISILVGRADAQSGDAGSLAEQLFNQARDLARANRWVEACPKFEASLRYDPALGTRLNLATCYEHIDKLASAWGLYRESIDLAKKAGDTRRRDYAQAQATALEPRLAKLTISAPASAPAGLAVTRDGTPIEAGALGIPLYIDAGPHEIKASAPGFAAFVQTILIVDGKTETVAIPALTAKPAPAAIDAANATRPKPAAPPIDAPPPPPTRKYIALGAGIAGVAAVGVGLVFGARARSTYDEAKALCGSEQVCSPADYPKDRQLIRDARSSGTISTVLVIAGGGAILAGAILFVTAPRAEERATARVVPVVHDRGAGLAISGRF